jgi:hypothetical protein
VEDVLTKKPKTQNTYKMAQDALYPSLFNHLVQGELDIVEFFPSEKKYDLREEYYGGDRDEYALLKDAIAQRMNGCLEDCFVLANWCKENHFYCMPFTKRPEKTITNEKLLRQYTAALFFNPAVKTHDYAVFDEPTSQAISRYNMRNGQHLTTLDTIIMPPEDKQAGSNTEEGDEPEHSLAKHLTTQLHKKLLFRYQCRDEGAPECKGIEFLSEKPVLIAGRWCVPCSADGWSEQGRYSRSFYVSRRIDVPAPHTTSDEVDRLQRFTDMLNLAKAFNIGRCQETQAELVQHVLLPFFAPTKDGRIIFSNSVLLQALERELATPLQRKQLFQEELKLRLEQYNATSSALIKSLEQPYFLPFLPDKKEKCLRILTTKALTTAAECDRQSTHLEELRQIIINFQTTFDWQSLRTFHRLTNPRDLPDYNVGIVLGAKQQSIDLQNFMQRIRYLHAALAELTTSTPAQEERKKRFLAKQALFSAFASNADMTTTSPAPSPSLQEKLDHIELELSSIKAVFSQHERYHNLQALDEQLALLHTACKVHQNRIASYTPHLFKPLTAAFKAFLDWLAIQTKEQPGLPYQAAKNMLAHSYTNLNKLLSTYNQNYYALIVLLNYDTVRTIEVCDAIMPHLVMPLIKPVRTACIQAVGQYQTIKTDAEQPGDGQEQEKCLIQ